MKRAFISAVANSLIWLALFSGADAVARVYSTSFPATENPISEGGNWINGRSVGLDWSDCASKPGLAYGLQPGPSGYDDAVALLTGAWASNQTVTAVVRATNQRDGSLYEEVELRLRSSLSPHNCTGYEVLFSMRTNSNVYVQIVRWNGPLGSWAYVAQTSGPQYRLRDGDEVKATMVGSTIKVYINGTQVLEGTDTMFTSGSPGMGFYLQGTTGANTDYGFKSFTATDGSDRPAPPPNLRVLTNAQSRVTSDIMTSQSDDSARGADLGGMGRVSFDKVAATDVAFNFAIVTTLFEP